MINNLFKKSGVTLMELVVVVGIFSLIVGVSLTLLSTGRLSVFRGEAQIQAEEHARQAINRISKELRLSGASRVHIYDSSGNPVDYPEPGSGPIIYFQIPVGSYDTAIAPHLDTADYSIQWGDGTDGGKYIYYYLKTDEDLLFRCPGNDEDVIGNPSCWPNLTGYGRRYYSGSLGWQAAPIINSQIESISFSRQSPTSNIIEIEVQAKGQSSTQEVIRSLKSRIKLRN